LFRKSLVLALPLGVLAALTVAPTAAPARLAGATLQSSSAVQFSDAPGDSGAAPDITDVDVGNDLVAGSIVFWVTVPNRPDDLVGDEELVLWLNTDRNPATGDQGDDYAISVDAESVGLYRWDGATFAPLDAASLSARFSKGDKATRVAIHPNDLGGTTAFDFFAQTFAGEAYDLAPNGEPAWSYSMASGKLALTVIGSAISPKRPVAGKTLLAGIQVGRSDINEVLDVGKVGCKLQAGTASVRAIGSGLRSGVAICSWKVPKSAKGKLLKATVSVTYGGVTAKKTFTVRAR
jgi:hypothetical protein